MKPGLIAASVFAISLFALQARPAWAADACGVKVESVDEDRDGFSSRTMWNASLFSVTLLAKEPVPTDVSLRVYTLGNAYRGAVQHVRWFPSGTPGIYRSTPTTIAFPRNETFLHIGVSGATYASLFQPCALRLISAFSPNPRLALMPLHREDAALMQPVRYRPKEKPNCPDTPARIAAHSPPSQIPSDGLPGSGGPYVSVVAVHLTKTGTIKDVKPEVRSGLSWLDDQALIDSQAQQYAPATSACRPVAGTYYYATHFDTQGQDDPRSGY